LVSCLGFVKLLARAIPNEYATTAAMGLAVTLYSKGTPVLAWQTLLRILTGVMVLAGANILNRSQSQALDPAYLATHQYLGDMLPFVILFVVHNGARYNAPLTTSAIALSPPLFAQTVRHVSDYFATPAEEENWENLRNTCVAMMTRLRVEQPAIRAMPLQLQPMVLSMYDWGSNAYAPSVQIAQKSKLARAVMPTLRMLDSESQIPTRLSYTSDIAEISAENAFDVWLSDQWKRASRQNIYVIELPTAFDADNFTDFKNQTIEWANLLNDPLISQLYKSDTALRGNFMSCVIPTFERMRLHSVKTMFIFLLHLIQNDATEVPFFREQRGLTPSDDVLKFENASVSLLHLLANTSAQPAAYQAIQRHDQNIVSNFLKQLAAPQPPLGLFTQMTQMGRLKEQRPGLSDLFEEYTLVSGFMQGQLNVQLNVYVEQIIAFKQTKSTEDLLNVLRFADKMAYQDHSHLISRVFEQTHTSFTGFFSNAFIPLIVPSFSGETTPLLQYYLSEWNNDQNRPIIHTHSGGPCIEADKIALIRTKTLNIIRENRALFFPMTQHKLLTRLEHERENLPGYLTLIQKMYAANQSFFWGNLLSSFFDLVFENPDDAAPAISNLLWIARHSLHIGEFAIADFYDYVYTIIFLAPMESKQYVLKFNQFAIIASEYYQIQLTSQVLQQRELMLPT